MNKTLTVYDPQFIGAVNRHIANIERSIAKLNDPNEVAEIVARSNALENYAKQIRADNETLNQLLYAKLLCCGRLGKLLPRMSPRESGALKGKGSVVLQDLNCHTLSTYRKIGDHFDQIEPWYASVQKQFAEDSEAVERLHVTTFLREVGAKVQTRVKNYKGNAEWYTPSEYVEAARKVMGSIDCDPASNEKANKTVQASVFYTAKQDGLTYDWNGNVWLNPPYNRGLIAAFCDKLIEQIDAKNVKQAIVLTNNTTDTRWWHLLADRASRICFTRGRIKFLGEHNNTNGQTFLYFGRAYGRFASEFNQFGIVFPK